MEDFGYQKDGEQGKFSDLSKRAFLVFATLFSLIAFVYITINAYYFVYQDRNADIETIKSPEGPIKVVEEEQNAGDSSQMQVDHKIYEDIFGKKKEATKIENTKVRNAPEPALPPKIVKESTPVTQENIATKEQKPEQKIVIYSNDKQQRSQDLLTKTDGEKRDNTAAPAMKPSNKKRAVRVQVAAMTSEAAAEENWKRLNRLYSELFSGLKPFVEKIDLGKRGVFYRLQIGNFYNQVDAENFCNSYVAQAHKSRADCIIVE